MFPLLLIPIRISSEECKAICAMHVSNICSTRGYIVNGANTPVIETACVSSQNPQTMNQSICRSSGQGIADRLCPGNPGTPRLQPLGDPVFVRNPEAIRRKIYGDQPSEIGGKVLPIALLVGGFLGAGAWILWGARAGIGVGVAAGGTSAFAAEKLLSTAELEAQEKKRLEPDAGVF